jgi:class 3 adenylate cyclase
VLRGPGRLHPLTEELGDQAAAALVESLAVLVRRLARAHGGVPAKWLGDGGDVPLKGFARPVRLLEACRASG